MLRESLVAAMQESGLTSYRIGKDTGLHPTQLDRFVSGERDLSLTSADKLCRYFGMRLTRPKKPQPLED